MRSWALFAAGLGLLALYAQVGWWPLGFVALLPWLALLDRQATGLWRALAWGALLAIGYQAAALSWFGLALARYAEWPAPLGLAGWLLAAPFLQPQWLAFALARHGVARWTQGQGVVAAPLAGALALLACEWATPRLLGDTLGHGLVPSLWLRQLAELGGAALLTLLLVAVNESLWAALRMAGPAQRRGALALALALLLAAAGYGVIRVLTWTDPEGAMPLRVGLVQANVADLESRRRTQGADTVVRELLDLHFAMSYDALERQGADAVLWSETIYPTTLGRPKSAAGAAFDAEILATVAASGRPFVIGTYDRDAAGEYNSAAFLDPQQGLVGHYRKTYLFPLTEWVPPWADALHGLLPWLGRWQPGQGARPFALRLQDGRELAVQALICRDATDTALALAGARLGAQALFTLSNDSWFAEHPQGARLHLAVSSLRSVETRLPQWRVTSTGQSAVIDALGRVQASGGLNERTLVVGSLPVSPQAPATPLVRLGNWLGPASVLGLIVLWFLTGASWRGQTAPLPSQVPLPAHLVLLPGWGRWATALLRALARLTLLGIGLAWLALEDFRAQTLLPLRLFAGGVLLPELLALCVLAAYRVQAR
ncbi:MAG: apolipoprotein N-acyltransferase, partial [Burkholderiales bacterium]|nr:apolipoprotein N-acyltransferase [Burkholderiales bacterium]